MKLTKPFCAMFCLALFAGCSDDDGGGSAGYQLTVTGPRNPDGWIFEFPGEDADPFVGERRARQWWRRERA